MIIITFIINIIHSFCYAERAERAEVNANVVGHLCGQRLIRFLFYSWYYNVIQLEELHVPCTDVVSIRIYIYIYASLLLRWFSGMLSSITGNISICWRLFIGRIKQTLLYFHFMFPSALHFLFFLLWSFNVDNHLNGRRLLDISCYFSISVTDLWTTCRRFRFYFLLIFHPRRNFGQEVERGKYCFGVVVHNRNKASLVESRGDKPETKRNYFYFRQQ